ncbi:MAG: hypothetical protein IPN75_17945 [Dechloromonas sp.]|uniref:Uncharacterized protein n=1 Tax=Candidatus Dechloromonas phosphorivorans TaxID=2899244 RepID=A0A9D7LQH6_9RHOO|nr:hypothetical protein [Candidatus Dechloromonas phosphorivorans]
MARSRDGRRLQVDDQVAGVVRHLDQEGQRVPPPGGARNSLDKTGRPRHPAEGGGILLEEAEFLAALAVSSVATGDDAGTW